MTQCLPGRTLAIPVTARRRRREAVVSDFCLGYALFPVQGCTGGGRIFQECYARPYPQSRGHRGAPYDLVTPGGHGGKVRDAGVDTVSGNGPLEQKTESDWVAVRNSHEVTDDQRATAAAAARNTAGRPNRSLRDIIVPTSHAGINVEQRLAPGMSEAVRARTVPRIARPASGCLCCGMDSCNMWGLRSAA